MMTVGFVTYSKYVQELKGERQHEFQDIENIMMLLKMVTKTMLMRTVMIISRIEHYWFIQLNEHNGKWKMVIY